MEKASFFIELLTYISNVFHWALRCLVMIGIIVFGIIKCIHILRKDYFSEKKRCVVISIISLVINAFSWFLNMGWLRFYMTLLLAPVIHSVIFFYMNLSAAKYFKKSPKVKRQNLFFILTFLIFHIFTPDLPLGNDGDLFFLFGLINNPTLVGLAVFISIIAFIGHIVTLVMQIAEINNINTNVLEDQ